MHTIQHDTNQSKCVLNKYFSSNDMKIISKYMKERSTPLITWKIQMQTTGKYHLLLTNNTKNEICQKQEIFTKNEIWICTKKDFGCCECECRLMPSLWKIVWNFQIYLKIRLLCFSESSSDYIPEVNEISTS